MPERDAQFLRNAQAQVLQIDQILAFDPIEQHALHVMLKLVLAVEGVQARNNGEAGGDWVENAVVGENVGVEQV